MYAPQPKKLLIMNILDILKRYTDEDHRLSQREIGEILDREYGMTADRKSIRRNLLDLIDCGYDIEYSESIREKKDGSQETMLSDWYLNRTFTDSELRLLIDGLLFSKHVPYSQCRELVEKLESLSNIYFHSRVKHIHTLPENTPNNRQLFYTIDVLDEAISRGRQVSFHYTRMGLDKKPHPRTDDAGNVREYIVNPYQLVTANGRYYLICNYDKYDNVSHYRVDRIRGIRLLDAPAKPPEKVKGLENGLHLPEHMAEHLYMFTGESVRAKFRVVSFLLDDLADWFGTDVAYPDVTEETVTVPVRVNGHAMEFWALQYAPYVEVLEPVSLREKIGSALCSAAKKYKAQEEKS